MSVFREAIEVCRRLGVEMFTISLEHLDQMDKALDKADQSSVIADLTSQLDVASKAASLVPTLQDRVANLETQLADAQAKNSAAPTQEAMDALTKERDDAVASYNAASNLLTEKTAQYGDLFATNQTQANKIDAQDAKIVELQAEVDTLKLAVPTAADKVAADAANADPAKADAPGV